MITPFLAFFQSTFLKFKPKHTFNCLYNANLFKTSCSTPFRLSLCLEPISAVMSRSPLSFLSKTRLKYYFNTAHYYQDLHCSLMYRCPTAVLITRDTAKSAFHYNLYTLSPAITCQAVHCQLSNIPLHCTQLLATCPACPSVVLAQFASPAVSVQFAAPSSRPSSSFYCSNCSWCSSLAFTDPVQLPRV